MTTHTRTKHERTIKHRVIRRNATPGVMAWCYVCSRKHAAEPTHRWAEGCPTEVTA